MSATTSCGPDCCRPCREAQLHEDQSDLANWTRGDRKARFEQTAERHAGLNQFAAPFPSRMKFVDEQGEEGRRVVYGRGLPTVYQADSRVLSTVTEIRGKVNATRYRSSVDTQNRPLVDG